MITKNLKILPFLLSLNICFITPANAMKKILRQPKEYLYWSTKAFGVIAVGTAVYYALTSLLAIMPPKEQQKALKMLQENCSTLIENGTEALTNFTPTDWLSLFATVGLWNDTCPALEHYATKAFDHNTPLTPIPFTLDALHLGTNSSDIKEIMIDLIRQGADVETKNKDNQTILHQIVFYLANAPYLSPLKQQYLDIFDILIHEANINVNSIDIFGFTPLHTAILTEHLDTKLIEKLIKAGADVNALTPDGLTPKDFVQEIFDSTKRDHHKRNHKHRTRGAAKRHEEAAKILELLANTA